MSFTRRTAQVLHEDHCATLALIEDLERLIGRFGRRPPDLDDPATRQTLQGTAAAIDQEVCDHFKFEEDEIFTRLADNGEVDIGVQLCEEHRAILPAGKKVSALAKQALGEGFDDQSWPKFKVEAGKFIEPLLAHVHKEEMALLPLVDELLDPETDLRLYENYSNNA